MFFCTKNLQKNSHRRSLQKTYIGEVSENLHKKITPERRLFFGFVGFAGFVDVVDDVVADGFDDFAERGHSLDVFGDIVGGGGDVLAFDDDFFSFVDEVVPFYEGDDADDDENQEGDREEADENPFCYVHFYSLFVKNCFDVFAVFFVLENVVEVGEEVVFRVAGGHPGARGLFDVDAVGGDEAGDGIGGPEFAIKASEFWVEELEDFWGEKIAAIGGEVGCGVFWVGFFD